MTNKEKILDLLKKFSKEDIKDTLGLTANEIAENLNLKRNVVSHYLNELYEEGIANKTNSRPVYYSYKTLKKEKSKEQDIFKTLIGHDSSLKLQVDQCKIAASYPSGLPIILTGESGVGKSFIANLIYDYGKSNNFIKEDAPFIIFNCAEYANNPELLTAKLFGYQKGAFTGATSDTYGLIEEANDGYLFLDEVHRLSPEGQEKLFLVLDKGIYSRLGENSIKRKANIRFIFATTEDPEEILLETFLRRIPLNIKIPSLSERSVDERLAFIYRFYKEEAEKINCNIEISEQVLNFLSTINLKGNIGSLINIVKYSCAYSYNKGLKDDSFENKIFIHINNLPPKTLINLDCQYIKKYNLSNMVIDLNDHNELNYKSFFKEKNKVDKKIESLSDDTMKYKKNIITFESLIKSTNLTLNNIVDDIIFKKEDFEFYMISKEVIGKNVKNALKLLEENYGIKYYGNTSNVLSEIILYFWQNSNKELSKNKRYYEKVLDILKELFPKCYMISSKLLKILELSLDCKFDYRLLVYLNYYFYNMLKKSDQFINTIIIAHGYSTASSIASVSNKLIGEFIFEAFDMPIEVSTEEIAKKIKKYLKTLDTTKGVLILVDMGSLEGLYDFLKDSVNGDIGIINNITTQIALDVGIRVNNGSTVKEIIKCADKFNTIKCQYFQYENTKKNVILTTCISGLGTALKIRDALKDCINDKNIEVLAYDYNKLKHNKLEDDVFKEYNVLLIVGTCTLKIKDVPYINIDNLITRDGEKVLNKVLKNKLSTLTLEDVNNNIIKQFSLQNILNRLTMLNPNKIIDQSEVVISNLEVSLKRKFNNNLKVSLLIHISCLVERIIMRDYIDLIIGHEEFIKNYKDFIDLVNRAFHELCTIYKIEIPLGEIQIIHQIIENA